jgi:pSer/pThr/pTyr-binding forkhead associated (FHA) protein
MSAVVVLILRILMTISLYAFLGLALFFFLKEMQQTIHQKEHKHIPGILLQLEGLPSKVFSQTEILIGRDPQNDLQLQDDTISGRHARIFYSGNQWMVEDSASTNGTFLNDERIISQTALVENDVIRCGKIMVRVEFQKISPGVGTI